MYKFIGYKADDILHENSWGGGFPMSSRFDARNTYEDKTFQEADLPAVLKSCAYSQKLDHGIHYQFSLKKEFQELAPLFKEYPIIGVQTNAYGYGWLLRPYGATHGPENCHANMPKFFFNSRFATSEEAAAFANVKRKELPPFVATKEGRNLLHRDNNDRHKHLENIIDKARDNSDANFVIVADTSVLIFRNNVDNLVSYTEGHWQALPKPTTTSLNHK